MKLPGELLVLEFRALGFWAEGLGFRTSCLGFKVWGLHRASGVQELTGVGTASGLHRVEVSGVQLKV